MNREELHRSIRERVPSLTPSQREQVCDAVLAAITAEIAELQAKVERLEGERNDAIQNQNANWQLYMDMHHKWESERTFRQHTESQLTALQSQLAEKEAEIARLNTRETR